MAKSGFGWLRRKDKSGHESTEIARWPAAEQSVRVLLVEDDPDDVRLIRELLQEVVDPHYEVTTVRNYEEAVVVIRTNPFDVYILDYYLGERTGMDLLRTELQNGMRGPAVILTGVGDRDLDMAAMRSGAAGFLDKSRLSSAELDRTLRYATGQHRQRQAMLAAANAESGSRVICCVGVKGGVGTTSTVANLGIAIAGMQRRVMALDLRCHHGTLAYKLGLEPASDLESLLGIGTDEINVQTVHAALATHPSGVRVLASPSGVASYGMLDPSKVGPIIETARAMTDVVLLDLPAAPDLARRTIIDNSDLVLLVSDLEPGARTACEKALAGLRSWRTRTEIGLVGIGRTNLPVHISAEDLAMDVGLECFAHVAPSREVARESLLAQVPAVSSSPSHFIAHSYHRLAERLLTMSVASRSAARMAVP